MDDASQVDEETVDAQRKARFGALPPRIQPDDFIGEVETRKHEGRHFSAVSDAQASALPVSG
ncbi:hypothetical protein FB565_003906 [Actinoplanes lutulentus]|uniref:Uncharacterized protein n=1 Tax=Actinoplanes lutulentus TaxID=1287878 RepID=A0A327ZJJ9_9ACTN|nr:hypothetical protein [Actinoplanes lutulentus]MBB2944177.1 hypothetical protein [Actinoplanes lutulentus]RAK42590.1 hypothetical protein B0I29_102415 [Actinoplanes lutulentus]